MKSTAIFTLFILLILSCKSGKTLPQQESGNICTNVPDSLSAFIHSPKNQNEARIQFDNTVEFLIPDSSYCFPCFNPNNKDEFVFLKIKKIPVRIKSTEGDRPMCEMQIFNLKTKQSSTLQAKILTKSAPIWSTDGWIYYTNDVEQTRVHPKTEQVEGLCKPCYGNIATDPKSGGYVLDNLVFNSNKEIIDTLPFHVGFRAVWTKDNKIYGTAKGIAIQSAMLSDNSVYADSLQNIEQFQHELETNHKGIPVHIQQVEPIPNSDKLILLLRRQGGIWIYDQSDRTCTLLKQGAHDSHFNCLSVSPDGKQILASFHREVPINGNRFKFNVYEKIYIMDINGCNMEEVVLE